MPNPVPQPSATTPSPLFQLPPEVRQRIWEHYLAIVHGGFFESIRPMHTFFGHDEAPQSKPSSGTLRHPSARADAGRQGHLPRAGPARPRVGRAARPAARAPQRAPRRLRGERDAAVRAPASARVRGGFRGVRLLELVARLLQRRPGAGARAGAPHHRLGASDAGRVPPARGGWEARRDEKKEGEFLDMLGGLKRLQTLRFYGRAPEAWMERVRLMSGAQVKSYSFRWWREPGMDRY
ncbi:short-chain dehydrogenase reductase sdr [Apiospora sp. TS-2023a]